METTKKTLKISFYTQKGGVGKSTITTLLASVLHYRLGYNVLVMDCDFPQHSLTNMRARDLKTVMENDYHKKAAMKQFQTINKKAYTMVYIIFMIIGIVGYFTVPTAAGWIIQAGGAGNFMRNVNQTAMKTGNIAGAGAGSTAGNIGGKLMGK